MHDKLLLFVVAVSVWQVVIIFGQRSDVRSIMLAAENLTMTTRGFAYVSTVGLKREDFKAPHGIEDGLEDLARHCSHNHAPHRHAQTYTDIHRHTRTYTSTKYNKYACT